MRTKNFDINASLAIKGIAILMMLFHHMFRSGVSFHETYDIIYYPFPEKNICNIATVFKICVGLFAFVCGYGLYLNYKRTNLSPSKWVVRRITKLLSGFWFVVVCCWIVCQIINGYPQTKYFSDNIYKGIINMLVEFFGCSTLFGTPTLTHAWWYMSAGIVFIVAVPFTISFEDKMLPLLLTVVALPRILGVGYQGETAVYSFLFAFLIGVMCAKYDFINKWINCQKLMGGIGIGTKFVIELVVLLIGYKFYRKIPIDVFWEFHYGVYPLLVILFAAEFIVSIPVIQKCLVFLGKHSANMYFVHALILYPYLTDFIYEMPYFMLSYLVLIGISLGISVFVEILKKMVKYEKKISTLLRREDFLSI